MTAADVTDALSKLEQVLDERIKARPDLIDIKCMFTHDDSFSAQAAVFQVANVLGKLNSLKSVNLDTLKF